MQRIALASAATLVGVGLWASRAFGSTHIWLYGLGLLTLVGMAVEAYLDALPSAAETAGQSRARAGRWVAPALLVTAGLWLVQVVDAGSALSVAIAVAGLTVGLLEATAASLEPGGRYARHGVFISNLLLYLSIFVLFALIYHARFETAATVSAAGAVALLGAVELLRGAAASRGTVWFRGVATAVVVGEAAWVVGYWPVSGLVGGALLLVVFYVMVGLLQAIQDGRLEKRTVVEYLMVGGASFLAVISALS